MHIHLHIHIREEASMDNYDSNYHTHKPIVTLYIHEVYSDDVHTAQCQLYPVEGHDDRNGTHFVLIYIYTYIYICVCVCSHT